MAVDVQVMLVSAQAAPNLLAAADAELKPRRAVLVTSAAMRARAEALAGVLHETGIATERFDLSDEHRPQSVADDLLALAARLEVPQVHLNLTGGTKLMALTALSVAEMAGWLPFYVDVDTDHVVWLGRDAAPPRKLNEAVRLRHYLGAYGIRIEGDPQRRSASAVQRAFVENVLAYYERYRPALPLLNGALQRAEDQRALVVELTDTESDSRSLAELLEAARDQGFVRLEGRRLALADEAARDFLKGGWLEQHVSDTVAGLGGELAVRDRAVNLNVLHGDVRSELDVVFLCRNRLHVIECKTANLQADDGARANGALFKLAENARRLGGLATRSLLVSYRPLREAEQRLARLLQVETVHGRDVPRLREKLLHWCRHP
jgi:hypothetical protein